MAETPLSRRRAFGRIAFVGLALFIIFLRLVPLETAPPSLGGASLEAVETVRAPVADDAVPDIADDLAQLDPVRWIAPDLLILLTLAWVIRRPSYVAALTIAAVFLLADMLFQRPPGLWAGLVLILSEILRTRSRSMRTLPFWLEWVTVAGGVIAITMIYRVTLSFTIVPQAPLGLTLVHLMLTLALYPAVVFVSYAVFGVSRPAPGEVDALGHRI